MVISRRCFNHVILIDMGKLINFILLEANLTSILKHTSKRKVSSIILMAFTIFFVDNSLVSKENDQRHM